MDCAALASPAFLLFDDFLQDARLAMVGPDILLDVGSRELEAVAD
jgi:hypothetical protein